MEAFFDRQARILWWDQAKLHKARVMVVGAGALGNEVIKNLALIGVGNLLIVDFDIIEDSNLSRAVLFRRDDLAGRRKAEVAAERARELSPLADVNIRHFHGNLVWELGAGIYRHVDLVIGCLDNIEARLATNLNCWKASIPWIDGGIYELSGSISVFDASPDQACYECSMDKTRYDQAGVRYSCTNKVVKARIRQGSEPTTQTTSALMAALQTQEAVKLLHGMESLAGRRVVYHGHRQHFVGDEVTALTVVELLQNPTCMCHAESKHEGVVELWWAKAKQTTAQTLLIWAQDNLGLQNPSLELGRQFVIEAICPLCGRLIAVNRPAFRVLDTDVICPECEVQCPSCGTISRGKPDCPNCGQTDVIEPFLDTFHQLTLTEERLISYRNCSLYELGIPLGHILTLTGKRADQRQTVQIELSGDIVTVLGVRPPNSPDDVQ